MPSSTRAPLIWSIWATLTANKPGLRNVTGETRVPRRIRYVSRARPASVTHASVGPGRPLTEPIFKKWSLRKKPPKPSVSARAATANRSSYVAPCCGSVKMHKSESCMSVDDRLVDELLQLAADRVDATLQELREELHGEVLVRGAPHRRSGCAAPRELTDAARQAPLDGIVGDADTEPETDPVERRLGEQRSAEGGEVDAVGQMVAGHVLHGARSEDAHAVELAAAQQHLGEPV